MSQLSIEEIKSEISRLEGSKLTLDETKAALRKILEGHTVSALRFKVGEKVYRAIKYKEKPKTVKGLGYPPKEHAKANRASRQNVPIFYSGFPGIITLFEMNLAVGDRFVISEWEVQKNLIINPIGYSPANLQEMGSKINVPIFVTNSVELTDQDMFLRDFLSAQFTRKVSSDDEYHISIAIAEIFLDGDIISGIAYPPVKANANGHNIVLKTGVIDDKLIKLNAVNYMRVDSIDPENHGKYSTTTLAVSNTFSENDEIIWKNLDLTKERKIVVYKFENGSWIQEQVDI